MKIAILGYGDQGKSAYDYWHEGNQITVCDMYDKLKLPDDVTPKLGFGYLDNLAEFDLIVRSPSVHPTDIRNNNLQTPDILDKVTTVTNEFMRVCPAPIIGITGTKGKGTTSSLITAILKTAGKTVHLGGNIGIPPLDMIKTKIQSDDFVVLELANFQLIDIKYSPVTAVCVMVAPEHLNWHSGMSEYVTSKQQLFRYQSSNDLAVYNRLNAFSEEVAAVSRGKKISYEVPAVNQNPSLETGIYVKGSDIYVDQESVCKVHDVVLKGRHNLDNVCAAIAATWDLIGKDKKIIQETVKLFGGLPYRIEIIKNYKDIIFVNDSFGTTPETAIVAMQAFEQPKIMILGGSDKGADFSELAKEVALQNVKHVVTIGETGTKIVEAIRKENANISFSELGNTTMKEVVKDAFLHAKAGNVIMLSTACASFGMFKDYKDRGDQFNQVVAELASTGQ